MRDRWLVLLALVLVLATAALVGPALAEQYAAPESVVTNSFTVIGDSWGFLYYDKFRENMIEAGYGTQFEFFMRAVPGTEASQWVNREQFPCFLLFPLVKSIIKDDAGTPRVLISLGGNDLVNDYDLWGDLIYDRIEEDLRTLVAMLIAERPDVQIFFSGYEILNMYKTQLCVDEMVSLLGSAEPSIVNPALLGIGDRQALIAADVPQAHFAPVAGALQGDPGYPDLNVYSPLRYFVLYPFWRQDCIHMSFRGYDVYTGAIADWLAGSGVLPPPTTRQPEQLTNHPTEQPTHQRSTR